MTETLTNLRQKWRERSRIWGKNDENAHKFQSKMAGTLTNEVPQGVTVIKLWFGWGFLLSVCMWKLLGGKTGAARAGATRTAQFKGTVSRDFWPFLKFFMTYTVKVSDFPIPRWDVTNQTLFGRELLNLSPPGRVWLVTSWLRTGKSLTFFYCVASPKTLKIQCGSEWFTTKFYECAKISNELNIYASSYFW
jgi:hypothetical protein